MKKLKTIENIIYPKILYEYYKSNYNPKDSNLLSIVLDFFIDLEKKYNKSNYFEMNIPDLMAEYINKNVGKRDIEKYKRYCKNLWNSNKSGLAVFFLSKIKNINEEEQLIIFNNTMKEYIDMIKKIYKFIEKSNN